MSTIDLESTERSRRQARRFCRARRHGYVYVAVLATTAIVSLLALCAIQVARVQLRVSTDEQDWQAARQLAQSGVELGITILRSDSNWRTNFPVNVEHPSPALALNGGSATWKVVDLGGGNALIDGIGRKGRASCVLRADVQLPGASPLEVAIFGSSGVTVQSTAEQLTLVGGSAATPGSLTNYGTIVGNCEAKTLVGNSPVGTLKTPGPVRAMPDEQLLFSYYLANGTDITSSVASNSYRIRQVVLSPNTNPYGSRNSEGIYIVTLPAGQSLSIEEARIVGTLVVRSASAGVNITGPINWEPAFSNYPALLAQGPISVKLSSTTLNETTSPVNFNPPSTPWQTNWDLTRDDTYISALAGLIYCSGDATFDGRSSNFTMKVEGVLLSRGTCRLANTAKVTFTYNDSSLRSPPPGFSNPTTPRLQVGAWRQVPSY